MVGVGIDVSKGKSTVAIFKPYGEIVARPFDIEHTEDGMRSLAEMIKRLDGEVRVVMEATGIYHWPVLNYLKEQGIFVAVINPYDMKQYSRNQHGRRKGKTDRMDAMTIANYALEKWFHLCDYQFSSDVHSDLKLLGRQYYHYMRMRIESVLELTHLLDMTMPGIKSMLSGWNSANGKDKLSDFVEKFWHFDIITKMSEAKFVKDYVKWAEKRGYHPSQSKAVKIYTLAKNGIPTISATSPSAKMMVAEAVRVLKEVDETLEKILTQMQQLAKTLPEYETVRNMGGVGDTLAPKLIAEIGDVRRFHSGKALVAYAGIDPPPFQSGKFEAQERNITKMGSATLRKIGYEVMRSLVSHAIPDDDKVYSFIRKKEAEGKPKRAAKIAGLNKFLRIYYARVKEVYK